MRSAVILFILLLAVPTAGKETKRAKSAGASGAASRTVAGGKTLTAGVADPTLGMRFAEIKGGCYFSVS